jgi:hypothetical protein
MQFDKLRAGNFDKLSAGNFGRLRKWLTRSCMTLPTGSSRMHLSFQPMAGKRTFRSGFGCAKA